MKSFVFTAVVAVLVVPVAEAHYRSPTIAIKNPQILQLTACEAHIEPMAVSSGPPEGLVAQAVISFDAVVQSNNLVADSDVTPQQLSTFRNARGIYHVTTSSKFGDYSFIDYVYDDSASPSVDQGIHMADARQIVARYNDNCQRALGNRVVDILIGVKDVVPGQARFEIDVINQLNGVFLRP